MKKKVVYEEIKKHRTPRGGIASKIIYIGGNGRKASKEKAVSIMVQELDEKGNILYETIGMLQ